MAHHPRHCRKRSAHDISLHSRSGQARALKTWNVPYISTGEVSTQAYVNSAFGNRATAGQQVRCLDIRVPTGAGIFREGSNPQENAKLAHDLKAFAKQCHGTAGRATHQLALHLRLVGRRTLEPAFEGMAGVAA